MVRVGMGSTQNSHTLRGVRCKQAQPLRKTLAVSAKAKKTSTPGLSNSSSRYVHTQQEYGRNFTKRQVPRYSQQRQCHSPTLETTPSAHQQSGRRNDSEQLHASTRINLTNRSSKLRTRGHTCISQDSIRGQKSHWSF